MGRETSVMVLNNEKRDSDRSDYRDCKFTISFTLGVLLCESYQEREVANPNILPRERQIKCQF